MELIEHSNAFDHLLSENSMVLAFFGGTGCSVCHALEPRLQNLLDTSYPDILFVKIKTDKAPELSARHLVFTIPVILFFIEGKEYIREVRNIDISLLSLKLNKMITLFKS